jgi:transposase-like protein
MAKHRTHSIEFKRQVAQEFLAGETLHGLAKRHDICRNLIRVWVQKYEAGAFDEDAAAADLLQQYEARIAALERLVGKQALELEFVKGAVRSAPRPKSANTSVIVGPRASASQKGCRLMGIARSTFYDLPTAVHDDAAIVRGDRGDLRGVRILWLETRSRRAAASWHDRQSQEDPTPDARARSSATPAAPSRRDDRQQS